MAATDYDFILDRNKIIAAAYRKIGALSYGQPISASLMDEGVEALNVVIQDWQNRGISLWNQEFVDIALAASTSGYAITNPAIIGVERVFLITATSPYGVTDLELLSFSDYTQYRTDYGVSATGMPVVAQFNISQASTINIYPSPTVAIAAAYALGYVGITRLKDWDTATGSGDIPSKYQAALIYDLAVYLAPDHSTPVGERDRLSIMAEKTFRIAKGSDSDLSEYEIVEGAFSSNRGWR